MNVFISVCNFYYGLIFGNFSHFTTSKLDDLFTYIFKAIGLLGGNYQGANFDVNILNSEELVCMSLSLVSVIMVVFGLYKLILRLFRIK